ncbi:MAG: GvpL/GvpF family gas vesicle protein [Coprothermobacterota bacterium]|nr:GvpL/GvpF family gas vesicle protein [Coprothermobacterota bacterium]
MQYSDEEEVAPRAEAVKEHGNYLYCVAASGEKTSLGKIGIESKEVYTIPYRDICAVVHDCPAQPYQSDDQEVVKAWVMAHQKVIDAAWERWGTVLPLSFDTIIKGETEVSAQRNVQNWLKQEYEKLKSKIENLRGKAEYGVQVFWNPKVIAEILIRTSPEIRKLDEEIKTKPRGLAYMYRQRLENLIKREMEAKADECFKDFYSRIRKYVDDIHVEKTKKAEQGLQMIMNLSCLVCKEKYTELGEELDKINQLEGFSVRFTGPWPPYSFIESA